MKNETIESDPNRIFSLRKSFNKVQNGIQMENARHVFSIPKYAGVENASYLEVKVS